MVVLSAGRLAKVKNYRMLLEAAPQVVRAVPQARFVLAGDGPERAALEELRRSLSLEAVTTLLGERNDVPQLLAAADLFVLSSDFEATSLSLLEAMAAGLPVVATRVGGNPFLVADGEAGFLIPPGDPVVLADQVISLLRDPVQRQEKGQEGAERVRMLFSKERMLENHERLYLRLLEEKGKLRCKNLEKVPIG